MSGGKYTSRNSSNTQPMGITWCYHRFLPLHLSVGSVCSPQVLIDSRCVNSRRIKKGGGPVRYTGWTVPTYNQSQQQYGYTGQQGYNMNVPPQHSYQGAPMPQPAGQPTAYYDASQSAGQGSSILSGAKNIGYQPPPYPPPAAKA